MQNDPKNRSDLPGKNQRVFQTHKKNDFLKKPFESRPPRPVDNSSVTGDVPDNFEGMFKVGKNGIGYVTHKDSGFAVMVNPQHSMHSINGDRVAIKILDKKTGTGEVTQIIKRGKNAYAGIIEARGNDIWFVSGDGREPEMRVEPVNGLAKDNLKKKVLVKLGAWIGDIPTCEVIQIIGTPGENDTEMNAIVLEKGFDGAFPQAVTDEANTLHGSGIPTDEIPKRRDMRDVTTFTIDPVDAKDYDDALSFKILDDGNYEIGIHIADVSFYVTPGSALDDEAKERTTSVYLVDRVIPMLPEVLSNELCSIRQDEDKLAFSCIFNIEKETGKVLDTWYGRTIIKSNKRFSYEAAQEIITAGSGLFYDELKELMRISKIYTQERYNHGAISMDTDEVRFILDEKGTPIRVMIKTRIVSMRMIEEWMLMANKYVAMKLSEKTSAGLAVYRVHDKPAPDRVEDLLVFLKSIGYTHIKTEKGIIPPRELQKILDEAATDDARDTIQGSIVRSMAKAIYSTTNIGHFGLAFSYYTHFTSPIRRYPDVMVHRLLQLTLDHEKVAPEDVGEYMRMCEYSSAREKDAQDAERESIKYKQVEYMSTRVGNIYDGIITGLGKFGVYVAEKESKSEGMIRLMDLGNDYFAYDEKRAAIVGKASKKEFRFGDRIKIKVKETNLEKRTIDYVLVTETKKEESK
ncbi:MAG: Ribonuclease [Patescibacteria group bacterium]|nr:Ribonuclease [Patescibacteria group bacterium]